MAVFFMVASKGATGGAQQEPGVFQRRCRPYLGPLAGLFVSVRSRAARRIWNPRGAPVGQLS